LPEPAAGMPRVERTAPFQYQGKATEVLQAGSYTYVRVVPEGGDGVWAVGLHKDLSVGNTVVVRRFGRRTDFCSTRLGRCFDTLDFAVLGVAENP
jgi:hypothetical protein